jgi:hypothetical protein
MPAGASAGATAVGCPFCQPSGGLTITMPPHLGQARMWPMAASSRTFSRDLQVVQVMEKRAVICHLSFVSCQLSVVICQLSFVICHLSFVICQLSFVSCQLSVVSCQLEDAISFK